MEPIINPWIFYFMSVGNACKIVSFVAAGLLAVVLCIYIPVKIEDCVYDDEDDKKTFIKTIKKFIASIIVCTIIGILIPNEKTLTMMEISKNVTGETIETVTETIKTATDYVFDKFASLND